MKTHGQQRTPLANLSAVHPSTPCLPRPCLARDVHAPDTYEGKELGCTESKGRLTDGKEDGIKVTMTVRDRRFQGELMCTPGCWAVIGHNSDCSQQKPKPARLFLRKQVVQENCL